MYAQNLCGFVGPCVESVTIPYKPEELSTLTGVRVNHNVVANETHQRLDIANLGGNCSTDYLRTASLAFQMTSDLGVDPCAPNMLLPPGLNRAHPAWRTCVAPNASYGVDIWDPPRALLSVAGLTPIDAKASRTTTHTAPTAPTMTISASAGSQPRASSIPRTSRTPMQDAATPFHSSSIIWFSTDSDEILSQDIMVSASSSTAARSSVTMVSLSTQIIVASSGDANIHTVSTNTLDSQGPDIQFPGSNISECISSSAVSLQVGVGACPLSSRPSSLDNDTLFSLPKPRSTNSSSFASLLSSAGSRRTPSVFEGGALKQAYGIRSLTLLCVGVAVLPCT